MDKAGEKAKDKTDKVTDKATDKAKTAEKKAADKAADKAAATTARSHGQGGHAAKADKAMEQGRRQGDGHREEVSGQRNTRHLPPGARHATGPGGAR